VQLFISTRNEANGMTAPAQTLDNPFWAFSLKVYGAPGVADECLALQERFGLDVNLLLFAAYMGAAEGGTLDRGDIAAAAGAVEAWHNETVRALRGVRRALKPPSLDARNPLRAQAGLLRTQVKAAELAAEQIEQAMLWQRRAQLAERGRGDPRAALAANIDAVLTHYGAAGGTADSSAALQLQAAALAYAGAKGGP
jgi:uncharacterized protein (TIGR02444 family)